MLLTNPKFHTNSNAAWKAMLNACSEAENSIYIEEYVLDPDDIGTRFIALAERKAKQGVTVKLLLDWWGCKPLYYSSIPQRLQKAGAEIKFYRTPRLSWLLNPTKLFPRDHRKLVVTDNAKAFVGGVCMYDKINHWRDTMVEFEGTLAPKLGQFFKQTWDNMPDKSNNEALLDRDNPSDAFRVFANTTHDKDTFFTTHFFEKLNSAQHNIKLVTPYFTPNEALMKTLIAACDRGVVVEILLSSHSKYAPYVVGKKLAGRLIEAGVKIFYYQPVMLHLKQIMIDDTWTAIGSFNLDGLSLQQNEELMLTSADKSFNQTLLEHYKADKNNAEHFTYQDWQARPLSEKVASKFLLPLRGYL